MSRFLVKVTRISYAFRDIVVEAENEKEAMDKALNQAGDQEFSERSAEYGADDGAILLEPKNDD